MERGRKRVVFGVLLGLPLLLAFGAFGYALYGSMTANVVTTVHQWKSASLHDKIKTFNADESRRGQWNTKIKTCINNEVFAWSNDKSIDYAIDKCLHRPAPIKRTTPIKNKYLTPQKLKDAQNLHRMTSP